MDEIINIDLTLLAAKDNVFIFGDSAGNFLVISADLPLATRYPAFEVHVLDLDALKVRSVPEIDPDLVSKVVPVKKEVVEIRAYGLPKSSPFQSLYAGFSRLTKKWYTAAR